MNKGDKKDLFLFTILAGGMRSMPTLLWERFPSHDWWSEKVLTDIDLNCSRDPCLFFGLGICCIGENLLAVLVRGLQTNLS